MGIQKQAAEAVNMLMEQGVDFDSATDLVMEKVAGDVLDLWGRGAAYTERKIAKQYNQEGPEDRFGNNFKINNKASFRAMGRATLEGTGAGLAGGVAGLALVKRPVGAGLGYLAGSTAGAAHGVYSSYKNQAQEIHDKYRSLQGQEKQAAVNMLIEQGVDFDSAVDLVEVKAQELYGD